jgi:hypothetical protein
LVNKKKSVEDDDDATATMVINVLLVLNVDDGWRKEEAFN